MEAMRAADHQPPDTGSAPHRTDFDMPVTAWRALMQRIADAEPGALEELYDLAARRLYGFALWSTGSAHDAADIVSEVFVRVVEQGPRLHRVRSPRAWLLTVTRRLAVDLARERRRRPTEPLEPATDVGDTTLLIAPLTDPDRALDASRASAMLARLPVGQRQVVFLRHHADCTYAAIGRILGIPTFTAASRYRLAIRRLRQLLEGAP
jgi:RNA polymerase sigma-70 factor (ECF subfamily)